MNVNITYIKNEERVAKTGKKYTACGIHTKEHGDQWINGFGNAQTKEWEERKKDLPTGESLNVDIDVYEEEYNGQKHLKFKTISETDQLRKRVEKLEQGLKKVYEVVFKEQSEVDKSVKAAQEVFKPVEKAAEEKRVEAANRVSPDDLPF